ncbi:MAG TPA: DinB family protein [Longimicrobium sp.]|jgi:uncharacterized damage-inducible protein DinB|uniref:DinB family protein n=1 Tax=Longimicrobium sp. TaxID=2029185 RepID=UPI002ED7E530
MYRRIDDFISDWAMDSKGTVNVFSHLTDESLNQRVGLSAGRTLGRLAWHITETVREMMESAGVPGVTGPEQHSPTPTSAAEITRAYEESAASLPAALRAAWTDDVLDEYVPMYGQQWKRGTVLSALMLHQAHHRGQMTVLMRQAGLSVPGVYGPAAEEWAAMGMPALP